MGRRGSGRRHSNAASELALEQQPPFRVRWRNEPPDDAHGYLTIELGTLSAAMALRAFLTVVSPARSLLLVDAVRTLTGREERLTPVLAAVFRRHGLSRSLRVERTGLVDFTRRCTRRLTLAAIDGPIDAADASALERSIVGGAAPLDAELRADAIMQCGPRRTVWSQFRVAADARQFVGAALTSALARIVGSDGIPLPSDAILLGLVRAAANGCTIRPTDVRDDNGTIVIPLRSSRSGRVTTEMALDRVTARWYA